MILVRSDSCEAGLREDKCAIRDSAGHGRLTVSRQVDHVEPRLVPVHGVQDYLWIKASFGIVLVFFPYGY